MQKRRAEGKISHSQKRSPISLAGVLMVKPRETDDRSRSGVITHDDVVRIAGAIEDEKVAQILAAQPTVEELEEAVAWAKGESDVMGELERPLTGPVAQIYDILTADEEFEEKRSC
jgi:hypothetical protein